MKHNRIIQAILQEHKHLPDYNGCDTYKAGNPADECVGIAVALVPTVDVIRKAAKLGCNLLITHEPIYYQTPDFDCWRGSFPNSVQQEKEALLKELGITVWRDHDHMHLDQPDWIFQGFMDQMGWTQYLDSNSLAPMQLYYPFDLPPTTVESLADQLIEKIGMNGLRYFGKPTDVIQRIAIVGHLYPCAVGDEGVMGDGFYHDYAMHLMKQMELDGIQAIIPGEIIEWTILSYIRDAISLGRSMACLCPGHFNWEELGMRHAAARYRALVPTSIPVHYIPTGDAWQYIKRKKDTEK